MILLHTFLQLIPLPLSFSLPPSLVFSCRHSSTSYLPLIYLFFSALHPLLHFPSSAAIPPPSFILPASTPPLSHLHLPVHISLLRHHYYRLINMGQGYWQDNKARLGAMRGTSKPSPNQRPTRCALLNDGITGALITCRDLDCLPPSCTCATY